MKTDKEKINLYEKIQIIKEKFLEANIKKSGKNRFANYTYYELADITPILIKLCNEYKVFTKFSYSKELATLEIINIENPEEKEIYTSPMEELELKGCNKIQALGGTETYSRRYLYMSAFDIIENDMFDAVVSEEKLKDTTKLLVDIKRLMSEKKVLPDEVFSQFNKNSSEMSEEELKEVIKWLEEK